MKLFDLQFYSWKQEEITRGQIRWVRDNIQFFQMTEIAALAQQSWFHHHSRHSWQICSLRHGKKMALHWSSHIILQTFSTFHLCNLWSDDLKAHILQAKFPHI
jgi:hypothetical protein